MNNMSYLSNNSLFSETIKKAKTSISKLQINIINFLEKGDLTPINIRDFMLCYGNINEITGKIKGEDDAAVRLFIELIEEYIIKFIYEEGKELDGEDFLDFLIKKWNNFKIYLFFMENIFYKIKKFMRNSSLVCMAKDSLLTQVFDKISEKLNRILIFFIEKQRDDHSVPQQKMLTTINYFRTLSIGSDLKITRLETGEFIYEGTINNEIQNYYTKAFEENLLTKTINYYKSKALQLVAHSTPEYVIEAHKILRNEEQKICAAFVYSKEKYIRCIEEQTISFVADDITKNENSGVYEMIKKKKYNELTQIFELFSRLPTNYKFIAEQFRKFIQDTGEAFSNDPNLKGPLEYINALLDFREEMGNISLNIFKGHLLFENTLRSAFHYFMNKNSHSPAYLAIFCDNELKKNMKLLDEEEVDRKINLLITLFSYLTERDVFFQHYEKYFAKRFLNSTSTSMEYENKILSRLKVESGSVEVQKLILMQKDFYINKELNKEFQVFLEKEQAKTNKNIINYDISVSVIAKGYWPFCITDEEPVIIPPELARSIAIFESFYKEKHQNRNVKWLFGQGISQLSSFGFDKKYQFIVNNYQLLLILLFNKPIKKYSLSEIQLFTQIPFEEIEICLNPLLKLGVFKLLTQNNGVYASRDLKSKEKNLLKLQGSDQIELNKLFQSPSIKINCVISSKFFNNTQNTQKNESKEEDYLLKNRDHLLDSMIIRIMKAKKHLKIKEIIENVLKISNTFTPQPKMIKTRIESLIGREYIKRDENDL